MLFSEPKTIELTTTPTFVTITINLPNDTVRGMAHSKFWKRDHLLRRRCINPQEIHRRRTTFFDGDTLSGSWMA